MQQLAQFDKRKCNCIGQNLTQTHYKLGLQDWDPLSIYKKDYTPKKAKKSQTIDSSRHRKSSINYGDVPPDYTTTSSLMQENIPKVLKPIEKNKIDLQSDHFKLGNANNDYTTEFRREYTKKRSSY